MENERFFVGRWSEHQVGLNHSLLFLHQSGRVVDSDTLTPRFLRLCRGARTIEEHTQHIARATLGEESAVRTAVSALVDSGLLQPLLSKASSSCPTSSGRLDTVGVIGHGDGNRLVAALEDAATHVGCHGRKVEFLAADRTAAVDRATCHLLDDVGRRYAASIRHLSPVVGQRLAGLLSRHGGFDRELLNWAIGSGGAAASRNLLQLATAGRSLLLVDDDVRWTLWRLSHQDTRVVFGGHADPREADFFATHADAIEIGEEGAVDSDLLSAHEQMLGHNIGELGAEDADFTQSCAHILEGFDPLTPSVVRATFTGVAGNRAGCCPYEILFAEAFRRADVWRDPLAFDRALASVAVRRVSAQSTITHGCYGQTACVGLANTAALAPFMPGLDDGAEVFGAALRITDPMAVFGHLPWGVVKIGTERSSPSADDRMPRAARTTLADICIVVMQRAAGTWVPETTRARFRRAASAFVEIGELSPADFSGFLAEALVKARAQQLKQLDAMFGNGNIPGHWRIALQTFSDQVLAGVTEPEFLVPAELRDTGSNSDGPVDVRATLSGFGQLLEIWPDVWSLARQLGTEALLEQSA